MEPPEWMRWPGDELPTSNDKLLKESREEMYNALSLFHTHVRSVIYIMLSVPAVIVIFLRFWNTEDPNPLFYLLAGIFLVAMFFIGILAIFIINKYYKVYVSALIFTTRLHVAAGIWEIHTWLYRTVKQANNWDDVKDADKFLKKRTRSITDTFSMYASIIVVISLASLACGIILFINY